MQDHVILIPDPQTLNPYTLRLASPGRTSCSRAEALRHPDLVSNANSLLGYGHSVQGLCFPQRAVFVVWRLVRTFPQQIVRQPLARPL